MGSFHFPLNLTHAEEIFRTEAAEDEDPKTLNSYFVDKDEYKTFYDAERAFQIVRGRKGMGKSALLSHTGSHWEKDGIVTRIRGLDLRGEREIPVSSPDAALFGWQQRICWHLVRTLGTQYDIALSDDRMLLVEQAELANFKGRNIVGSLLSRIKGKIEGAELSPGQLTNAKKLLERVTSAHPTKMFLLIDDIDATFLRTREECLRLSTFFSACRLLSRDVEGLAIRVVVRADVWPPLREHDEALDKIEQYITDLQWNEQETLAILAERIRSYCNRNLMPLPPHLEKRRLSHDSHFQLLRCAFAETFPWKRKDANTPPHLVIHTLSSGRPRWALQLCKAAAKSAAAKRHEVITMEDIDASTEAYGQRRISDIVAEHSYECPQIREVITAFANGPAHYKTDELVITIRDRRILPHISPTIDGVPIKRPLEIAHFLFRIGFLTAREELTRDEYRHHNYEDRPSLLQDRGNIDQGMSWEIHPFFRTVLKLK